MKKVKLFEELNTNKCVINEEMIMNEIDTYMRESFSLYFDVPVKQKYDVELNEETSMVDKIKYLNDFEITIYSDEHGEQPAMEDLRNSIAGMLYNVADKYIGRFIKEELEIAAKEDLDNYLNNKKLYKEYGVKPPTKTIERGEKSGLWGLNT